MSRTMMQELFFESIMPLSLSLPIILNTAVVNLHCGFYFAAMVANKYTNNRYTFFPTDTHKQLVQAEQELKDYVDVLAMHLRT